MTAVDVTRRSVVRRWLHPSTWTGSEFVRFVVVRGLCAVLSYACFLLLLRIFTYQNAYAGSYVFGVALAYVVNARFVFRQRFTWRSALAYPFVYLVQFFASLVLLRIFVDGAGWPAWLAYVVSVGGTIPFVFLLSRWILRSDR
ncbi:GtrA family protein [Luteibacter sp. SG786]|uniref:GtrA family protein n=1 Tax=Luteibacter sp. SG786 TaxID=2587130 RepID=UPI0014208899|nr:GtrA family protein [Luteibacter sp. SG786]NII56426.1 putative flippase GtrA [Luteibacter sp. SG786]